MGIGNIGIGGGTKTIHLAIGFLALGRLLNGGGVGNSAPPFFLYLGTYQMCEILVKAMANYDSPDPQTRMGIYQAGDLVLGFEDGHEWGTDEILSPLAGGAFIIWRIPGMTLSDFARWSRINFDCEPFDSIYVEDLPKAKEDAPPPKAIARRRIYVDPAGLPVNAYNKGLEIGQFEFPPDTAYVKDKTVDPPTILLIRGVREKV
jgi:hypothetical protein